MIYFVLGRVTNKIKIGYTGSFLRKRFYALKLSSPDEFIFLGALSGGRDKEIAQTI